MAHCVGTTLAPFWIAGCTVLPGCAQTSLKHLRSTCMDAFMFFYFCIIHLIQLFCSSSCTCLVSICLLLSMENHSLLSKKKFMACTSHVSHPFDSVHVLFAALYCVKSQETCRVRKASFHAVLQLRNGVKGRTRALAFYTQTPLAFESSRVRICRVLNSQLPRLRPISVQYYPPLYIYYIS